MKNLKHILFVIQIFFCAFIYSQKKTDYTFTNYTDSDNIQAIAIHGDTVWVGTIGGLQKYRTDGTALYKYEKSNSDLPDNSINAIAIDSNGNKWIGTNNGLAVLSNNSLTTYNSSNSNLPCHPVSVITIENNGDTVWVGTLGGGITKISDKDLIVYNTKNSSIPNDWIYTITIDKNGDKWIGTNEELVLFSNNIFNISKSFSGISIETLAIDKKGDKWIGTNDGLIKLSKNTTTKYKSDIYNLPCDYIFAITIDDYDDKWIGTWGGGLAKLSEGIFSIYYLCYFDDTPCNYKSPIVLDNNGNKWIGTKNKLLKFSNESVSTYNLNSDLPIKYPLTTAVDINGDVIIGGDEALAIISGDETRVYNSDNSDLRIYGGVSCIVIDENNNKWIGTRSGITKFDNNSFSDLSFTILFQNFPELHYFDVKSIAIESNGIIWIGTNIGLLKYSNETFTVYDTANSNLPCNNINFITIDINGVKWISTVNGLASFSNNIFEEYNINLPDTYITSIATEANGDIWIGTKKGLVKLSNKAITLFDSTNSNLPDNNINALAIDVFGDKWIGTNRGLAKLSNNTFTVYDRDNSDLSSNIVSSISINEKGVAAIICGRDVSRFEICNIPDTPDFISGPLNPCMGGQYNYSIPNIPNASSYKWISLIDTISKSETNEIYLNFPEGSKYDTISVRGVNECGIGDPQVLNIMLKSAKTPQIESKWNNDVLICSNTDNAFIEYQWGKNGVLIPGATKQYYETDKEPGDYTVIAVNTNGCSMRSKTENITNTINATSIISANETVYFNIANKVKGDVLLNIYSMQGIKVKSVCCTKNSREFTKSISVSDLRIGIYYAEMIQSNIRHAETIILMK